MSSKNGKLNVRFWVLWDPKAKMAAADYAPGGMIPALFKSKRAAAQNCEERRLSETHHPMAVHFIRAAL